MRLKMYKTEVVGEGNIRARVVADSIGTNEVRLTTMELRYPRFIHSEFMTHRMFSRNASSSRAIPIERMKKATIEQPAMPVHWGKNQKGMQAGEEVSPAVRAEGEEIWRHALDDISWRVNELNELGIHKQVVNRLIEPFQFITVVVTATEWQNFFDLRDHPAAQPEIRVLAQVMKEAMLNSTIDWLGDDGWHIPYVPKYDAEGNPSYYDQPDDAIKSSVARCARVSYKTHDGAEPNLEADIQLYTMLKESRHLSPFEHVATPMAGDMMFSKQGLTHIDLYGNRWSNNFREWVQYRALVSLDI